jgi:geranylgeranyl diphosphate synthase type I
MHSVAERDDVEAALAAAIRRFDGPSPVTGQLHHHFGYLESGPTAGRRLRMCFALAVALAEGGNAADALEVGAAVEILYQYMLVHRDIEDADDVRDGRSAVWRRYGVAHGINAGDALCALAYLDVLASYERRPPERTLAMTRILQMTNYAMCAGRATDLAFDAREHVDVDTYLAMVGDKTGAVYDAAARLGALEAGADDARAAAYGRLARAYGCALQILDDARVPSARRWTYPAVAAANGAPDAPGAVRALTFAADAAAVANGIDVEGGVRAFFAQALTDPA